MNSLNLLVVITKFRIVAIFVVVDLRTRISVYLYRVKGNSRTGTNTVARLCEFSFILYKRTSIYMRDGHVFRSISMLNVT
jgi:hypothetical protein